MITAILGAIAQHGTPTAAAYAARHLEHLRGHRERGVAIEVSDSAEPLIAYVNHGRWVGMCACGAGVAIEPSWAQARCFGCGTVHTHVLLPPPAERLQIEHTLLARAHPSQRHWLPQLGETLEDLRRENIAHPERLLR